ncbi:MAG: acyl-CoA dehydrogenase family protein [Dehalococcoidia bacterium]|nr:acyl-CoA dehydrogenase family protein [Dehalococcoidia bacterium]
MDFRFSTEHEQLRAEIRAFLDENVPRGPGPYRPTSQDNWDQQIEFNRKLAQRGWVAPAWPEQYGGRGWSTIPQMIFNEELSYAGAPDGGRVFSVGMIGPTLIVHGTEEQKREHLPASPAGKPSGARATANPVPVRTSPASRPAPTATADDYVVNGQKIWTTGAHHADWMFLLVRTDPEAPKHKGISFLLADMRSPGITVNPIVNMAGAHEFNEVYFEDVRVPAANRVGEENNGWYVAMTLLDFERSSVATIAAQQRTLELLAGALRESNVPESIRAVQRHQLADLWISNEIGRMLSYRIGWMQESGQVPNYEASVIKVFATELGQKITNAGVNILGAAGQLEPDSPYASLGGVIGKGHLSNVAPTIYSGSSEIMRNIIATPLASASPATEAFAAPGQQRCPARMPGHLA